MHVTSSNSIRGLSNGLARRSITNVVSETMEAFVKRAGLRLRLAPRPQLFKQVTLRVSFDERPRDRLTPDYDRWNMPDCRAPT